MDNGRSTNAPQSSTPIGILMSTDLIYGPEGHDENGHKEVGYGQAENQVVGHDAEVAVNEDGGNDKHIS